MAKILVTGAAGFIGVNFCNYVIENTDHEVLGFDAMKYAANPKSLNFLNPGRFQFLQGDLLDTELLGEAVAKADLVVHFAAETHNDNSIADPRPFMESNVLGTFNLLEAVRMTGKRLHHISTDEVFGDLEIDDPERFSETSPYNPSSPYSSTKAASDLLVRAWVRTYGIAATISNCSNNFGPFQHVEKFIPRQITNILMGEKPKLYGSGRNVRDWIYVDDHSAAVLKVIEHGTLGETYLIGADGEKSNIDVLQMILNMLGKPSDWFERVNDRPGHDLRYAIDNTKLRRELGWKPRASDFSLDLERTIKWYRDNLDWWADAKLAAEKRYAAEAQ